jgi:selenocysteine lyase/cysteine desulfurase
MVANGYPFQPGDEIVSFVHEYPANHYPWRLQEQRGVRLRLVANRPWEHPDTQALPGYFTLDDVEALLTDRTRVVALSHVQFTSGFATDLRALGDRCRQRGIDLVVDAAQSMGCLPLHPEEMGISAVAAAGWKWLLGPFGTGVFYTAPSFRDKLSTVLVGAETMQQGMEYLDHRWTPHTSAKRFEYSSLPLSLMAALQEGVRHVHLPSDPETTRDKVLLLQDTFLAALRNDRIQPLRFAQPNRSGILALSCPDPPGLVRFLADKGMYATARNGFVRIAPFLGNTVEEMEDLAAAVNDYD